MWRQKCFFSLLFTVDTPLFIFVFSRCLRRRGRCWQGAVFVQARCRKLPLWLRSHDKRMTSSLCYIFLGLGFRSHDIPPQCFPRWVNDSDDERRRRDNRVSDRKWCGSGANIPLFRYIKSYFIFRLIHNSMVKMTMMQNIEIHFIYVWNFYLHHKKVNAWRLSDSYQ